VGCVHNACNLSVFTLIEAAEAERDVATVAIAIVKHRGAARKEQIDAQKLEQAQKAVTITRH